MTSMKRALTATLILAVLGATPALAGVSLFAGATLPQEDFKDVADNGLHGGLEMTVPIIPSLLSVGGQGSISYNAWKGNDVAADWYTGEVLGIAKLSVPITGLYVKAGLGFNRYSVSSDDFDYESETHLCGAIGAGMDMTVFDLNVMYHVVKWDTDADAPETLEEVDVSYSYFTASVGFGF